MMLLLKFRGLVFFFFFSKSGRRVYVGRGLPRTSVLTKKTYIWFTVPARLDIKRYSTNL